MAKEGKMLVNLGCGQVRPEGWLNYDSSLNSLIQSLPLFGGVANVFLNSVKYERGALYLDLRNKWPFEDGSLDVIYASHVFEHLSRKNAQKFILQSFNKLKSGGVIRLVVPDLEALASNYLSSLNANQNGASEDFLYAMNLHKENTYKDESLFARVINVWQGYPHQHKYMYDAYSLQLVLEQAGFTGVKKKSYGVSDYIKEIIDVENTGEGVASVYLEAIKS